MWYNILAMTIRTDWTIDEIRRLGDCASRRVDGALLMEVNFTLIQVAFTPNRPDDSMKHFLYRPTDGSPIRFSDDPLYGVVLGTYSPSNPPSVNDIPIAVAVAHPIDTTLGACVMRVHHHVPTYTPYTVDTQNREELFYLMLHPAAPTLFARRELVFLGDTAVVSFPYDERKVKRAKELGGRWVPAARAWVFPKPLHRAAEQLAGLDLARICGV